MPTVSILVSDTAPPRSQATGVSNAFIVVTSEKGPVGPYFVRSMKEFTDVFGDRVNWATGYDALYEHFFAGGSGAWVVRKTATTAVTATASTPAVTPILVWTAKGSGAYYNSLAPRIVAGSVAGTFKGVIDRTVSAVTTDVESSPEYATSAEIANWFTINSAYFSAVPGAGVLAASPRIQATGGNDNIGAMTNADRDAALAKFSRTLGPGQVTEPGGSTQASWDSIIKHTTDNERFGMLELPDTSDKTVLKAALSYMRTTYGLTWQRHGMFVGGNYPIIPGVTAGSRLVAYPTAIVTGLVVKTDADYGPAQPSASTYGVIDGAIDLTRDFTDADYADLNSSGVNIFREERGTIRLGGFRTIADKDKYPLWFQAGQARLLMYIIDGLSSIGDKYVHKLVDGGGQTIGKFVGEQVGFLQTIWQTGALFGDQPSDAFRVDGGAQVNTTSTLEASELRSVVTLRMSSAPEEVKITIVKKQLTEEV